MSSWIFFNKNIKRSRKTILFAWKPTSLNSKSTGANENWNCRISQFRYFIFYSDSIEKRFWKFTGIRSRATVGMWNVFDIFEKSSFCIDRIHSIERVNTFDTCRFLSFSILSISTMFFSPFSLNSMFIDHKNDFKLFCHWSNSAHFFLVSWIHEFSCSSLILKHQLARNANCDISFTAGHRKRTFSQ